MTIISWNPVCSNDDYLYSFIAAQQLIHKYDLEFVERSSITVNQNASNWGNPAECSNGNLDCQKCCNFDYLPHFKIGHLVYDILLKLQNSGNSSFKFL